MRQSPNRPKADRAKKKLVKPEILFRVRLAFLPILFFSGLIFFRVVQLQTVEGDRWRRMAALSTLQNRVVKATRGNLYADNGSLLATSLPFYRVAFDPTVVDEAIFGQDVDSLGWHLSRFFGDKTPRAYAHWLRDLRTQGRQFVYLNRARQVDYQERKQMESWPIFREGRMGGGVIFEKVERRFRPFEHLAERTVGYYNEGNGAGLEYSFNQHLAGRDGSALYKRISGGVWKPIFDGSEIKPEDGLDVQTTIDINLQDVAEDALLRALVRHEADYGCIVVMEVRTGAIKAMANLGLNKQGHYHERYNYAVGNQGRTDPGSTFKLASFMALFEETNLRPTDSVETGNGEFRIYQNVLRDSKPGGHGKITLQEAFEKSSNVAIAQLVNEHFGQRPSRFTDYIRQFGLDQPLGFQLVGEARPYVKKPSDPTWSGITLPWMSVGYELQLSPLQVLAFYNAVANRGRMVQPIIVRETRRADRVVERFEPRVLVEKICSDQTLHTLRDMLVGVVERGTARNIRDADYPIAGKTGTSQKFIDGQYNRSYYTSFAGFFPAHRPKYSCIVVIDNPKGKMQYGSDVAAPVFKEVSDKIYSLDVELHRPLEADRRPPAGTFPVIQAGYFQDLNLVCNALGISNHLAEQANEDWVRAQPVNNSIRWQENRAAVGTMPDVRGMTLRDALFLLENQGVQVRRRGQTHGRVATQQPAPGQKLLRGSQVQIGLE